MVAVGAEQFKGTLHLLSLTGGAVHLNKRFAAGTLGDIAINTVEGNFSAAMEFLQMAAAGKAQAFRFIAMSPVARERLQDTLKKMRGQGLAVDKTALDQIRSLARQVLSGRSRK